jgi:uncharacterized protein YbbC (DUF1343 family)
LRVLLYKTFLAVLVLIFTHCHGNEVTVGADVLFTPSFSKIIEGKRIGLITNHSAVDRKMKSTIDLLKENSNKFGYKFTALFAPEHGITGAIHADDAVDDEMDPDGIPIYSLHGKTKRPTKEMLQKIDILIYDIQDIGSRSYTYNTTLFYAMEEAAKEGITVLVLDRPNPISGTTIDGPMLEEAWRSFVGYINVPYCHGMTVGELALFFNKEYNIGCKLKVIPMRGWRRDMTFQDTGLTWIPTSPHIPEASTAWYYPTTGILGELQVVNIGVGYTLPFKVVGAPWIDAQKFSDTLNAQHFPGVTFQPFHYRPFYGKYLKKDCHGIFIVITDINTFLPVTTQYLIIGILKSLYPAQFKEAMAAAEPRKEMFSKVNGTEEVFNIMANSPFVVWKLKDLHKNERQVFAEKRKKYLLPEYQN